MIGALIDDASFRPKKKKVILAVIPASVRRTNFPQSFLSIAKVEQTKGKRIQEAAKKRKKARVKGGIFCKANLKIGAAAPQIRLATIRDSMAFCLVVTTTTIKNPRA